jgi:hypothetical protein
MSSQDPRSSSFGGATLLGRPAATASDAPGSPSRIASPELIRALAEVKGQAQFLLYLADQLEDALQQLAVETDPGHGAFLCKILSMYSGQLETKHQHLGDRIAEACQELYVTVREYDAMDPPPRQG